MKVIVKPDLLSAICVHEACHTIVSEYKKTLWVPKSTGTMFHYRVPEFPGLGKGVEDRTALKYKNKVMQEMKRVCALIDI